MTSIYDISLKNIRGEDVNLAAYRGQILLIVNVASRCGFTRQYKSLEKLYREFKAQGLVVLGFPCDQFAHQEPGSNEEIAAFANTCFMVTFPMFAKIKVKGKHQSPLYRFINRYIPWNFTKVLIDRHGKVQATYWPIVPMTWIRHKVRSLIKQAL